MINKSVFPRVRGLIKSIIFVRVVLQMRYFEIFHYKNAIWVIPDVKISSTIIIIDLFSKHGSLKTAWLIAIFIKTSINSSYESIDSLTKTCRMKDSLEMDKFTQKTS